jgi:hypothetical protein
MLGSHQRHRAAVLVQVVVVALPVLHASPDCHSVMMQGPFPGSLPAQQNIADKRVVAACKWTSRQLHMTQV